MLRDWELLRAQPDEFTDPVTVPWDRATSVAAPAPIGALGAHDDIDAYDWWLRARLDLAAPTTLTFHGLTSPGTVFLNGNEVAEVESMFLPVRVDCNAGTHEVVLRFASLRRWLRTRRPRGRWRSTLIADQGLRWLRTTLIGRAPVYGAGQLPAPVGVWRPITLGPNAAALRITTDAETGRVRVDGAGEFAVLDQAGREIVRGTGEVTVPDPQLWWPNGYGSQHLYTVQTGDLQRRFGFRSLDADRSDDGFAVIVNGQRIFARGATWTPPDPVALTADITMLRTHLEQFAAAGATMVRVVGGMVYEQPEFYDLCAELGLLVWQDVMQATFDPPAEMGALMCGELTELLTSLSGNPAVAVVSGGSETEQQAEMLGVDSERRDMPLLRAELPSIATEFGITFVTSTPSSPNGALAIRPDIGVAHWFGVGGYLRGLADVRSAGVRFAAESLAFAIPPSTAAVEKHFGATARAGHHPDWKAGVPRDRTASWDFEDVRDFYVREMFDVDPMAVRRIDPERYLQLGRLAVAQAMVSCYAFWRQQDSRCDGALVLSGKDLVPGAGWGLLDSDGDPKLPLAALARVWAPVALTVTDAGLSGLRVDAHNDTPDPLRGTLQLTATDGRGNTTCTGELKIDIPARGSTVTYDADTTGMFTDLSHAYRFGPPVASAVDVRLVDDAGIVIARDALVIAPTAGSAGLTATAAQTDSLWALTVTSAIPLRYVCIEAPGWRASEDCFALAAGVPYRVALHPIAATDGPPRGTVSSIDALDRATIAVTAQ